jgi:hypothetical protein
VVETGLREAAAFLFPVALDMPMLMASIPQAHM